MAGPEGAWLLGVEGVSLSNTADWLRYSYSSSKIFGSTFASRKGASLVSGVGSGSFSFERIILPTPYMASTAPARAPAARMALLVSPSTCLTRLIMTMQVIGTTLRDQLSGWQAQGARSFVRRATSSDIMTANILLL